MDLHVQLYHLQQEAWEHMLKSKWKGKRYIIKLWSIAKYRGMFLSNELNWIDWRVEDDTSARSLLDFSVDITDRSWRQNDCSHHIKTSVLLETVYSLGAGDGFTGDTASLASGFTPAVWHTLHEMADIFNIMDLKTKEESVLTFCAICVLLHLLLILILPELFSLILFLLLVTSVAVAICCNLTVTVPVHIIWITLLVTQELSFVIYSCIVQ